VKATSARAALLSNAREGTQLGKIASTPEGHLRKDPSHRPTWFYIDATGRLTLAAHQRDAAPATRSQMMFSCFAKALRQERAMMTPIRKLADVVIGHFAIQRSRIAPFHRAFRRIPTSEPARSVVSFGYRYVAHRCRIWFSTALLAPNPHFRSEAAPLHRKDPKVRRYIRLVSADRRVP